MCDSYLPGASIGYCLGRVQSIACCPTFCLVSRFALLPHRSWLSGNLPGESKLPKLLTYPNKNVPRGTFLKNLRHARPTFLEGPGETAWIEGTQTLPKPLSVEMRRSDRRLHIEKSRLPTSEKTTLPHGFSGERLGLGRRCSQSRKNLKRHFITPFIMEIMVFSLIIP